LWFRKNPTFGARSCAAIHEQNLLETMVNLLGGKKYKVAFKGYIRVSVHGVTVKIPVAQSQEVKLISDILPNLNSKPYFRAMLQLFIIGLLMALVLIIFSRAMIKLRQQSRLMSLQSKEIQKQMLELEQRNRELEKLNHEKVQIISIVAHDLKGPFNRIFALTQLMSLNQQSLGAEQQEYLGKIHQIATDGLGLVRNVLDSKKFDEKGITLNIVSLDLALLVSSAIKNHRVVAEKKNIEIIPDFRGASVVETDKLYVGRVVDNLLAMPSNFPPRKRRFLFGWPK